MTQRLRMPFKRQMMLCGYKNERYKSYWGYPHYGIDVSSVQGGAGDDDTVYSSGSGVVLAAGKDDVLGFGAAVLYKNCVGREGEVCDVLLRYMHMRELFVKAGDTLQKDGRIGREGKEGTLDYHLHLEVDTDVRREYACWTPQVAPCRTFWKKGTDSTLNPSLWLWQEKERETVSPTYNREWLNAEDLTIPVYEEGSDALSEIALLAKKIIDLTEE